MSDYESDDDWKPPSEAEMKAGGIIQKLKGQNSEPDLYLNQRDCS